MPNGLLNNPRSGGAWLLAALLLMWCVGLFGRGYWTPDEPREADIAWRMSWQPEKAVPLLAGEAFCEKPPLTYWLAAVPIRFLGAKAWVARLPNLLYALITALAVGLTASRSAGRFAGLAAAAAVSTFLLSYQVAIWLATDAPLLASVAVALLGTYRGFYATSRSERLRGYALMHVALGVGFLSKSAVAWMVPALALLTLSVWEKRWRELIRWELYAGLLIQAVLILSWVWFVYVGDQGAAHLRVFFWNNLIGRFATVDAPVEIQYAAAHQNTPGKYFVELPMYLFPWTLLVIAAARRAWQQRKHPSIDNRSVRFAVAASLPPLLLLSLAATARNIYFAPALPGVALLVGWWAREVRVRADVWDVRALRGTAVLLMLSAAVFAAVLMGIGYKEWPSISGQLVYVLVSVAGLGAVALMALRAWAAANSEVMVAQWALLFGYCALLIAPASQIYRQVDRAQNLEAIGRGIAHEAGGRPLVLIAPDETTRALIDMYASTSAKMLPGPLEHAIAQIPAVVGETPTSLFVVQVRGVSDAAAWPWLRPAGLQLAHSYSLPYGRRYALLESRP